MALYKIATFILLAYLIGSIPTSVWLGKLFYSIDVRQYGSGNGGATNTIRVLGAKVGVPVLIVDVLKGFFAVRLAYLAPYEMADSSFVAFELALGTVALIGHVFPVFAQFKGGKGVATLLGFMLAVQPQASLVCLGIFILVIFISKIVSVSSMTAALSFPFIIIFALENSTPALTVFSILVAIAVIITHRKNIRRLLKNEESKVNFRKKEQ
jgi:glycerol-3-phosphate acyltransferase PlsY